jgi:lipoprotein-releasing system permease protein
VYKYILASRYLFRRRISYLALLSVALCVFIVIIVMTVLRGLVTDFTQKNHTFVGDCVVGSESLVGFAYYEDFIRILEKADFVSAVSPVISSYALVTLGTSERGHGVEIMGIDPVLHSRATGFGQTLHYHEDNVAKAFEQDYDPNVPGCVLGINLALEPDSKGSYTYSSSLAETSLSFTCFPLTATGTLARIGAVSSKQFIASDVSQSGLARVDTLMIYLPFEQAQLLCTSGDEKRVSRLHIRFKQGVSAAWGSDRVTALWQDFVKTRQNEPLANLLANVTVQNWKQFRREFIAAMEKEQTMMTAMFGLVGLTTVFIIFVVFYMIVSHKTKDIGILKSVGAAKADVIKVFLGFAFLVGICGSVAGSLGGWLFLAKINRIEGWLFEHFKFQLWDRTIYAIGDIPNQIELGVLTIIVVAAVCACLTGALIPSWQAAKLKPVETLQVTQI